METIRIIAAILSPLIVLGATAGYIKAIVHGDVRPHRISWTIWTIATAVGLVATIEGGAGLGAVVPATYLFIELVVTALAWTKRFGQREKEKRYEKWLAPAAIVAVIGWPFLPLVWGVWVAIIGDLAAATFTLTKAVEDPKSEPVGPWAISCLGAFVGLFALESHAFTAAAFPVYLVLQTGLTSLAILWGHHRLSKKV
jgi:hypothetical protein